MSWEKNWFSYLVWLIYVLAVGVGLIGLTEALCASSEIKNYLGIAACVVCVGLLGLCVFLIHRYACKYFVPGKKDHAVRTVVEAAVAVILLAVGLVLRIQGMEGAGEKAAYFETASVTAGQSIPALVHGAEYFYLQMLHTVYYFLGNRFVMGIWLQILAQFGAVLILFFSVRHMAGHIAAIVMLGFCMCSSYMIQGALTLSPEMLYLLFWSGVFAWVAAGHRGKLKAGRYLPIGILIAVMSYMDVAGLLLFFLVTAVIFCVRREKHDPGAKLKAILLCILGMVAGFVTCIFIDSCLSVREFEGVLKAWLQLYRPETFRIPVSLETSGISADYIILFVLLTVGIFSFWCDRWYDHLKIWVLGIIILVLTGCFGFFTQEMPVNMYLYLLMVLMAGIGVEECFRPVEQPIPQSEAIAEQQAEETGEQPKTVQMIENPLPLPKKHEKRVLDYGIKTDVQQDDFDIQVDEDDDFDI